MIDPELKFILSFSHLLSQYQECSCDPMWVDPYALGYFHQLLHAKVLDVMEALDVFLPLHQARQAMEMAVDEG
ncbi:hypothetical protein MNBD_ALPHA03-1461 [hydrothermal vent metagenome]|uniref:Uncharacterized protein n=1 Tax=hydrothermal vent metagenome TaxID=652676 RepID=A0A3B1B477_9ZZZZ